MKYYELLIRKIIDDNIFVSAVTSGFICKIVQSIYTILSVVLTLPYLGQERFGVWMLVSSLIQIFGFLDFGFINSIGNKLIRFKNNNILYKKTLLSSILLLILITLTSFLILLSIYILVDVNYFLNSTNEIIKEAERSYLIFSLLFPLNIYAVGVQKIFASMQKMHYANLHFMYGMTFSVLSLIAVSHFQLGVDYLILTNFLGIIYVGISLTIKILKDDLISYCIDKKSFKKTLKSLTRDSKFFWVLQILAVLAWGGDYLFISTKLGVEMVGVIAILQKIFFFISQPLLIINNPLWMIYGKSLVENNREIVKYTFQKIIIFNIVFCLSISLILYLLIKYFGLSFLIKGYIDISFGLFLIYMIWVLIEAIGNSVGVLFNSHRIIFPQVVSMIIFILLSLPFKVIYLSKLGINGLILSTIFFYLLSSFIAYGLICKNEVIEKFKR